MKPDIPCGVRKMYLFCSKIARGLKYLFYKEFPDLFFFCFGWRTGMNVGRRSRTTRLVSMQPDESIARCRLVAVRLSSRR
jgi:hypothetical protein